jgi:hypothetical protein
VNGGNWNNNAANDPATLTGGIDYSVMTLMGTFQMAISSSLTGNVWTAVLSAAGWAGAAPAGYGSLDATLIVQQDNLDRWNPNQSPVAHDLAASTGIFNRAEIRDTRNYKFFQPSGSIKTVSGVIRELGVAVPGKRIDVYNRNDGCLIGTTTSDGAGAWSVPTLDQTKVRVVATDAYNYNSLAADNVTPA